MGKAQAINTGPAARGIRATAGSPLASRLLSTLTVDIERNQDHMKSPHDIVLETFDLLLGLLPRELADDIKLHSKDPCPLKKGSDLDIVRARILPRHKAPLQFWSSSWCFYEIGVGRYAPAPGEGLNLGGIGFTMFPDNKQCGGGIYRRPVTSILEQVFAKRPLSGGARGWHFWFSRGAISSHSAKFFHRRRQLKTWRG
jgi:hypothetical protein